MSRQAFAAYQTGAGKMPHGTVVDPHVFVAIAPDGIVTIIAHRSEMGTGVRTSLPLIVAEEMEADWSRVKVKQAHGDEVKFGNQDTDGSRSTRHYLIPMRQIGASARTMLEAAAAKRWGVPVDRGQGRQSRGGALGQRTQARLRRTRCRRREGSRCRSVEGLKLKDPKDFRYLGKGQISIVDLRDITAGTAHYGSRHAAARHEICRDRAAAGDRRQAGLIRCDRGDEGLRRREGDGGARAGRGPPNSSRSAALP